MTPKNLSRRKFMVSATAATCGGALALRGNRSHAAPLSLPLGLQLYSVRDQLAKDYEGTLKQVAALGYKEVEAAGFYNRTPDQVRAALSAAGLQMPSSHYNAAVLQKSLEDTIAFGKALGLRYIICSFPAIKNPSRLKDQSFRTQVESFTLEDYRWNADNFNQWGRKVKAAGMQFGYHNHTMEFTQLDGTTGFDEMMRLTDPALVTFELDCGWVTVGGSDPVILLQKYPERISMLHIKDFKPATRPATVADPPPAAELGRGTVKFRPLFEAASKTGHIREMFVEQEGFDIPPMEALRIDAQFMQSFKGERSRQRD